MRGRDMESPGAFRIGTPGKGWVLHRNRRVGERVLVGWKRPGEDLQIRVTMSPMEPAARRIPLPTLAEALMRNYGRNRSVITEIDNLQRVDFGAHEGWVVHARRRWATNKKTERKIAQAFVRAGNRLVMLTYIGPPEAFEKYAPDYAAAVERFVVLLPPDPPQFGVTLPEDLPQKNN